MVLKCYLIESAKDFIDLLRKPVIIYQENNENIEILYNKWKCNFIDLYNSRKEFICLAKTDIFNKDEEEQKILKSNFKDNYTEILKQFKFISNNLELWKEEIIYLDEKSDFITFNSQEENKENILMEMNKKEKENEDYIEITIFRFIIFIFQYINYFEERSITNNLWNYCLRSSTFSTKCFWIGIFTLLIQYICIGSLFFSVFQDYSNSNDPLIILISILSTILSLFYSYNTIKSYRHSRILYKFLLKIYGEYPNMSEQNNKFSFHKNRKITMKKKHILYNWWADSLSNFLLPLGIPLINLFIILNSESVSDAILNSVAIFFIVQIDEDLYDYSEYDIEKNNINFARLITSVIYCHYFPLLKDLIFSDKQKWFSKVIHIPDRYKNKIGFIDEKFNL